MAMLPCLVLPEKKPVPHSDKYLCTTSIYLQLLQQLTTQHQSLPRLDQHAANSIVVHNIHPAAFDRGQEPSNSQRSIQP